MPALQKDSWLLSGYFDMKSGTTATMGIETDIDSSQDKEHEPEQVEDQPFSQKKQCFVQIIGKPLDRFSLRDNLEIHTASKCHKSYWAPTKFADQAFVYALPEEECAAEFDKAVETLSLYRRKSRDVDENIWSPVLYTYHPRKILFRKKFKFKIKELPRLRSSSRVEILDE